VGLIDLGLPPDSLITIAQAIGSDLPVNPALCSWFASGLLQIANAAAASCSIILVQTLGDRDGATRVRECGRIARIT